ncbi:MAG: RelA/SpoT domain-containing protein [Anaerolineales bacterium]|nr:RelA/SpoT domain-containing protein [Anaerolineales bacterium]
MNTFDQMKFHENAPIDLESFKSFRSHPWILPINQRYNKDATIAYYARNRLVNDLEDLNKKYVEKNGRIAFTTIEGRVKSEDSFLKKLYNLCYETSPLAGMTPELIFELYDQIKDICGVRYSCPYYDEVEKSITQLVRPKLNRLGYATNLQNDKSFLDINYLDVGDKFGYRSYHFFVKVPTVIDIFGKVEMCLCEVQARTELQHVWAVKSHDLLYKPSDGWNFNDNHVVEDMKQLSNNLRFADQLLLSIRDRIRGDGRYEEPH